MIQVGPCLQILGVSRRGLQMEKPVYFKSQEGGLWFWFIFPLDLLDWIPSIL